MNGRGEDREGGRAGIAEQESDPRQEAHISINRRDWDSTSLNSGPPEHSNLNSCQIADLLFEDRSVPTCRLVSRIPAPFAGAWYLPRRAFSIPNEICSHHYTGGLL